MFTVVEVNRRLLDDEAADDRPLVVRNPHPSTQEVSMNELDIAPRPPSPSPATSPRVAGSARCAVLASLLLLALTSACASSLDEDGGERTESTEAALLVRGSSGAGGSAGYGPSTGGGTTQENGGSYGPSTGSGASQNGGSYGPSTGSGASQNGGSYGPSTGSGASQNGGSYGPSTGGTAVGAIPNRLGVAGAGGSRSSLP